jgi:hypothetical protein
MKRKHVVIMVVGLLALVMLLGLQDHQRGWEYARLRYGVYTKWSWTDPEISVEGESFKDLSQQLGVDKFSKDQDAYYVIDWAGNNGWELVDIDQQSQYSTAWFKRLK